MNTIINSLFARKSVRAFEEKEITPEIKKILFESAIQAPSAGNMNLYSMIDVTSQEKKDKLAILCDNQSMISKAKMVVVFLADYSRWYRAFKDIDKDIREIGLGDYQLALVDATIAAQNMVIAAESLGIGSCYIGDVIEHFEEVQEVLNIPQNVAPVCMLVLGYPDEQNRNRPKPPRLPLDTLVFENEYKELPLEDIYTSFQRRNPQLQDSKEFVKRIKDFKWKKGGFSEEMNRSQNIIIQNFLKK